MENTAYVALSRQTALNRQMQVTANNIANMTTAGFKSQGVLFNEYLVDTPQRGETLSMVSDTATFRRIEQGPLQQTSNPLDLALEGAGYFIVETAEGDAYSRAGNFSLNNEGEIVTQGGRRVLSEDGAPVVIPEGDTQIGITRDGIVTTQESGIIGTIGVVRFENEQELTAAGDGLYYNPEGQAPLPAEGTKIVQFMLEGSNVQPVLEMNRMIEITRSYQATQRLLQNDHERQRNLIGRLTQNSG